MSKSERNLEVRNFRKKENGTSTNYKVFAFSPEGFSTGAIKEMLTHIVFGQGERSVAFIPQGGDPESPEEISYGELRELRNYPRHDRLSQLDIDAMKVKTSTTVVVIEKI